MDFWAPIWVLCKGTGKVPMVHEACPCLRGIGGRQNTRGSVCGRDLVQTAQYQVLLEREEFECTA